MGIETHFEWIWIGGAVFLLVMMVGGTLALFKPKIFEILK